MLLMAAVVSFLLTPMARRFAFLVGAVDRPDPRKIHRHPTARLGGLAVVAGFCAPWLLLYVLDNRVAHIVRDHETLVFTLLGAGITLFAVGVVDDIRGLSPGTKLVFQVLVAGGMFLGGYQITELSIPFGDKWTLGWLALPVTVLWIVGLTNATNLLDGMDGLATGMAAVMALSLAMINIIAENTVVALLTFCLAGAALGFLPYNFTPARIFLGDSGSLFLGVVMAGISTISFFKAATATLILLPFLFALPLFDTFQVVVGRLRRGHHPFSPDKTHVHHRLLDFGFNSRQATTILYLVTLFLGVSAIILSWRRESRVFIGIALLGVLLAVGVALTARQARRRAAPLSASTPDPVSPDQPPASSS